MAKTMKPGSGAVAVYVGMYGDYEVPERFHDLHVKSNGLLDKRFTSEGALAVEYRKWIADQEMATAAEFRANYMPVPSHV